MRILQGKNIIQMNAEEFSALLSSFDRVIVDVGTGDGKNICRQARSDPSALYIGIDPAAENMVQTAQKIRKKPEKGGLSNVLLVQASAETPPGELSRIADRLTVYFPWGALLEGVAHPDPDILTGMRSMCRSGASFLFVMTYSPDYEAAEIEKRALPALSESYFLSSYKETLASCGYRLESVRVLDNSFALQFDSQWAKRLAHGRRRDFYVLEGTVL